jgi:hypothetical protein
MKNTTITVIMGATILIGGCGKESPSSSATPPPAPPPPPPAQADAASSSPAAQPALTAWQQGDKAAAVSSFLAADWSVQPLFAADSPLCLTESQLAALAAADKQAADVKVNEIMAQTKSLTEIARAVEQAGHDAASKGDAAQARKCFTSVKQCGTALESPNFTKVVQLVGKGYKRRADTELAKLGQ